MAEKKLVFTGARMGAEGCLLSCCSGRAAYSSVWERTCGCQWKNCLLRVTPTFRPRRCIEIIADALNEAGAKIEDVVRTRMFVTDISLWEDFARAHQEAFADVTPATSMVEVSRLIGDGMLIEIEADAIVDGSLVLQPAPHDPTSEGHGRRG